MAATLRLWDFVKFEPTWLQTDTSKIDDIKDSWFERRAVLQESSTEYAEFMNRLKREHAIETGVIERIYDLKKGVTETFIKEGFYQSYLSHGDTNIPEATLMNHLKDHLEAVDFIFDIVRENRPFTKSFVCELHQLVTRHQEFAEGRDQFGNKTQINLLRGKFKIRENNPMRSDGTQIMYCPPDHVEAEMDNLISIYQDLEEQKVHPMIIAAWFHHAFSTIHPFQDGNGRVDRLLSSLILIKHGYFPFNVLREESKVKYIDALEAADNQEPAALVKYFAEIQKRNIEKALNIGEFSQTANLEAVAEAFNKKLITWNDKKSQERVELLAENRAKIFEMSKDSINNFVSLLKSKLNGSLKVEIEECDFASEKQQYYVGQVIKYAQTNDYFFNRSLPKSWFIIRLNISDRLYRIGISLHHLGYEDSTLAIGAFMEYDKQDKDRLENAVPLSIKPHLISILKDMEVKEPNVRKYIEDVFTVALAQIANEYN
jgi:Fic family protein